MQQVTNWSGTVYIFPLLGAFLADSYWGRYNTIIIFSIIYILVSTIASPIVLDKKSQT